MSILRFNSLIKKYFSDELMNKLKKIYDSKNEIRIPKEEYSKFRFNIPARKDKQKEDYVIIRIINNNTRINLVKNYINMYWRDKVINFGTGTNRVAVMTDNYVFKIALDLAGCVDNMHEFRMSSELYPDVTKTYETNKLICVSEYVQVINSEQLVFRKREILSMLKRLSEKTSLMLDVGYVKKNMSNLGIRASDDRVVILDFGYIYTKLDGIQLTCSNEDCIRKHGLVDLEYNSTYSALVCPKCGSEYGVTELQSLITDEARMQMYKDKMDNYFVVNKEVSYFEVDEYGNKREIEKVDDEKVDNSKLVMIDKKKLEEDYISCCEEVLRQENIGGYVNPNLLETKEHLRKIMLSEIHGIPYEDLEPELQQYEPYDSLREKVDLCQVPGYQYKDNTNNLIKALSYKDDICDMDEDEYNLYRRVIENNNAFDNEFLMIDKSENEKALDELVAMNRQRYKDLGEENPYLEKDRRLNNEKYREAQKRLIYNADVDIDHNTPRTIPITEDEEEDFDYLQSLIDKKNGVKRQTDDDIMQQCIDNLERHEENKITKTEENDGMFIMSEIPNKDSELNKKDMHFEKEVVVTEKDNKTKETVTIVKETKEEIKTERVIEEDDPNAKLIKEFLDDFDIEEDTEEEIDEKQEVEESQDEAETSQLLEETKEETTTDIIEHPESSDEEYHVEIPMEVEDKLSEELCVKFVSIGEKISKKALDKMGFPLDFGDGSSPFIDYSIDEGNKTIRLHRNLITYVYSGNGEYTKVEEPLIPDEDQVINMSPDTMVESDMILDIDSLNQPDEVEDPVELYEKIKKSKQEWK